MSPVAVADLPGYRRRFLVTSGPGWARSDLEDDFHHMHVTVRHADGIATAIEPVMERWPWTTCPLAGAELQRTFIGQPLAAFAGHGDKLQNCTHLYDLATLAAAHAGDEETLVYDVLVSDPVEGRRQAELRRNGVTVMRWADQGGRFIEPAELAGTSLYDMRAWLDGLDPERQEQARILRWGSMVSHGRTLPLEEQSDASRMQPRCFTFQPRNAAEARRIGEIRDFSGGAQEPLAARLAQAGQGRKSVLAPHPRRG